MNTTTTTTANSSTTPSDLHGEDRENTGDYVLSSDPSKYVTLPIQNEKIWSIYQETLDKFWTVHEIYLDDDKQSMLSTFNEQQQSTIHKLLAFMFTSHYTIVTKDLFMQLMLHVEVKEASYYLGSQADTKKTHCMMYSLLLDQLAPEKEQLISSMVKLEPISEFIKWSILSTTAKGKRFTEKMAAFAALQGVVFESVFVLIGWLQKQFPAMTPGLVHSNRLIWRDERLNLNFSCMLFDYLTNDKLCESEAHTIVRQAVEHTKKILTKAIPVSVLGMDHRLIEQFIEHSADNILQNLKFTKLYNCDTPFDWLEEPALETHREKQVASFTASSMYRQPEVVEFSIGDDF